MLFCTNVLATMGTMNRDVPNTIRNNDTRLAYHLFMHHADTLRQLFRPYHTRMKGQHRRRTRRHRPPIMRRRRRDVTRRHRTNVGSLNNRLTRPLCTIIRVQSNLNRRFANTFFFRHHPTLPRRVNVRSTLRPTISIINGTTSVGTLSGTHHLRHRHSRSVNRRRRNRFYHHLTTTRGINGTLNRPTLRPEHYRRTSIVRGTQRHSGNRQRPLYFRVKRRPIQTRHFVLFRRRPRLLRLSKGTKDPHNSQS